MVKYGKVCTMKITITIPDSVWVKLEGDRGLIPRSTWIQELIIGKGKVVKERGFVVPKKEVVTNKGVVLDKLIGEIVKAMEVGDRDNWVRVKKLISDMGYEWNITTRTLSKDGKIVWKYI